MTDHNDPAIGTPVFIRTLTMYYTGRISVLTPNWIILNECFWIGDTGELTNFLDNGIACDIARMGDRIYVGRSVIVDMVDWNHNLYHPNCTGRREI